MNMMNISDIISVSFLGVFVLPILMYIVTNNLQYLALFISLIVFGGAIEIVKIILGKEGKFARPVEACKCDILCLSENDSGKPGYPSGHVGMTTFFVVSMSVLLFANYHKELWGLWMLAIGMIWIYMVAKSRIYKKCHTEEQVIVGFFAGITGALFFSLTMGLPIFS